MKTTSTTSIPALAARPKFGVVTAIVSGVCQVWVIGRLRKFARPCRVCGRTILVIQMAWRPSSNVAPNRADRVCLSCWPLGAEKGKDGRETEAGGPPPGPSGIW
jgi:hypothetical protein